MNQIYSIAKKELRAYFLSPVALIFLGLFLFLAFGAAFWVDTFFRRNIADVRPLFHYLPMVLTLLVAALTMRLWSEEQRSGTLEVLLTLPIQTHRLVLGKFLAGLVLLAVALALTIGFPLTVSTLGDLDWGPVIGGYVGLLLLASAYLAIGLCVSAATSNQIVAFLVTWIVCLALYAVGSDAVASFGGNQLAEVLRLIGAGSRFESIERGVIDLRDLVYYASLCGGFLFLNTAILEAKKWSDGESTRPRRSSLKLSVGLVIANLLVLNVGLASVRTARLDLTERGEYSISPVTKKLLRGLDAPLLLRGYFSAKTHPLLAPLVPRIRDMLEEYAAVGGSNVTAEFVDPSENPAAEKQANEDFGIKSVPFQFADRLESAIVNSYFHILVQYGDKYEVLEFGDLIEINVSGMQNVEVKLRNLEYDLTRAVKKVVYGFEPLDSLFARVPQKITLTAYVTAKTLPQNLEKVPELITKVAEELQKRSHGKFEYRKIDPSGPENDALRRRLFEKHRFKPFAVSLFGGDVFYLHLLLTSGDKAEQIFPAPEANEAELRNEITAALKRMTPGFLKTVAIMLPEPKTPPQNPMMMGRQPPPPQGPRFQFLRRKLGENYSVKTTNLKDGRVPGDADVLLVAAPENLDEKQRFAIDQFLMRGGAVVLLTGRYLMEPSPQGLTVKKIDSNLQSLLETWGITLQQKLVLDEQNQAFPVPVERNVMGLTMREIRMVHYPFWVDVRSSGMAEGNPIVAGLPSVTMQWVTPIGVTAKQGIKTTVLLHSTDQSWTQEQTDVQPDFAKYPGKGFGAPDGAPRKAQVLAIAATGVFESAFTGKPNPLFAAEKDADKGKTQDTAAKEAGKVEASSVIEKSPNSARLVVVGSADFVRDEVLGLSRQTGADQMTNNLQFSENLVDWSVEDVDLLSIRSRGTYARTLKPMKKPERRKWELINYGLAFAGLALIAGLVFARRRKLEPIKLVTSRDKEEV